MLPNNFTPLQKIHGQPITAWIGFHVPPAQAGLLAQKSGYKPLPPSDLHLTLLYFPEIRKASFELLVRDIKDWAKFTKPVTGKTSGIIRFNSDQNNGDLDAVCAHFDSPGIPHLWMGLFNYVVSGGWQPSRQHGFTPHITLDYIPKTAALTVQSIPVIEITFGQVVVSSSELGSQFDRAINLEMAIPVQYPWGSGVTAWPSTPAQMPGRGK